MQAPATSPSCAVGADILVACLTEGRRSESSDDFTGVIADAERAVASGDPLSALGVSFDWLDRDVETSSNGIVPYVRARVPDLRDAAAKTAQRPPPLTPEQLFGRLGGDREWAESSDLAASRTGQPEKSVFHTPRVSNTPSLGPWWSCPAESSHPDWQASVWQIERGRPCPSCLRAHGLEPNVWMPPEVIADAQVPGLGAWRGQRPSHHRVLLGSLPFLGAAHSHRREVHKRLRRPVAVLFLVRGAREHESLPPAKTGPRACQTSRRDFAHD